MRSVVDLDADGIGPGFSRPVADAQLVFRLVLDALAHPGRIVAMPPGIRPINDSGLGDAAAALALTLLDFETPVWLDEAAQRAVGFLRFHCGGRMVAEPATSGFAFAADVAALPPLDAFELGSDEFPDRSTTLVLEVPALSVDDGVTLTGPGIRERTLLHVDVGAGFWRSRAALMPLFPRGLDVVFTCGRRLAALPRTTVVEGF